RVHDGDFFILRHIWNNLDQVELLEEIVNPVVDGYYREHPDERRFIGPSASLDDLLTELGLIRELLTSGAELSDIQLFSQLKNLNEIKVALAALPGDAAARMIREVDQLLETVFASSKFGLKKIDFGGSIQNSAGRARCARSQKPGPRGRAALATRADAVSRSELIRSSKRGA